MIMAVVTSTIKGQIVIPADIRKKFKISLELRITLIFYLFEVRKIIYKFIEAILRIL